MLFSITRTIHNLKKKVKRIDDVLKTSFSKIKLHFAEVSRFLHYVNNKLTEQEKLNKTFATQSNPPKVR